MAKTFSNTSMKLFDTVDEMYEQWINGNRRSVVKAILESSTKRAAFLAVALSQKMVTTQRKKQSKYGNTFDFNVDAALLAPQN